MAKETATKVWPFVYFVILISTYVALIVQHGKEESEERVFPGIVRANLVEYFIHAFVFLAIPVLGIFASVRLVRLKESRLQPVGVALAILFLIFLVVSCPIYWHEFAKYVW